MRVCLLTTQATGGPVGLSVALLREVSRRRDGPEIVLLGPTPRANIDDVRDLLVPVHVRTKTDVGGVAELTGALRRFAPDVVHGQDRRAGLGALLARRGRLPVSGTYHGVPDGAAAWWTGTRVEGTGRARAAAVLGADALVARRLSVTVAPSEAMASFLEGRLRVPRHRLRVIRNGVPASDARGAGPARQSVRRFATVGAFTPAKATPLLIRAFAPVAAAHPDARLLLVGDGDERAQCEGLVRSLRLDGCVELAGHVTDVPRHVTSVDAFVLPSVNENLPLALLEAMAAGRPCIAGRVGAVPEALDGCGVLVPPGEQEALTSAMLGLAEDPASARQLGEAAGRRAARAFNIERCADDYVALWQELAEGGR